MSGADRIVGNSMFTKGVVEEVWRGLGEVGVVYPCVDTRERGEKIKKDLDAVYGKDIWEEKKIFLSINRFEKKKDVGLAIRAFAGLSDIEREGVRLVIVGMSSHFPHLRSKIKKSCSKVNTHRRL